MIKKVKTHILYHPNGKIQEEGSYYIDEIGINEIEEFEVPVGEWKGWYDNGKIEYIETFNDYGKNHGIFIYWNKNGIKTREWSYENGKKHGLFNTWYDNGQKFQETVYVNGKKNGLHTEWYDNGQKSIEGNFKFGVLISKRAWEEDGTLKR